MRFAVVACCCVLAMLASLTRADARVMNIGDLRRIVDVSDPQLSPDGKSIAVIVSRINWDEDRRDASLVLIDVATGGQRPPPHRRHAGATPARAPAGGGGGLQ